MNKKIEFGSNVLETITVALYENPIILFREYVQNSLDAHNRSIDDNKKQIINFHVSIDVDKEKKRIVIKDNGYGIDTFDLFQKRMLTLGSSEIRQDKTKYIGFRGIGRLSGLPFCNKLIFRNKSKNSDKIYECIWEGDTYRELLNIENAQSDLQSIVDNIVKVKKDDLTSEGKIEHFFEVIIEKYSDEIQDMLDDEKFQEKLIRMLPLKYHSEFEEAKIIIEKYNLFMNEKLERFMISVKYNKKDLFKTYNKNFVLGSKIIFWEIRGKQKESGAMGDKIGLLWFTFERHLKTNKNDEYYGILTRSKNVLMGENDTFAQVADNNKIYITTFREMAQVLRGIYGELLINSQYLRDNSRRDWFLPDRYSIELNNVITDFMRRLHNYRYCASRYYRSDPTKKKEDLIDALDELVDLKNNQIDHTYFYKKEKIKSETKSETNNGELFSEEDMPRENQTMKKYYDLLMNIIKMYFEKEKKRDVFLRLRAYLANHFKKK